MGVLSNLLNTFATHELLQAPKEPFGCICGDIDLLTKEKARERERKREGGERARDGYRQRKTERKKTREKERERERERERAINKHDHTALPVC